MLSLVIVTEQDLSIELRTLLASLLSYAKNNLNKIAYMNYQFHMNMAASNRASSFTLHRQQWTGHIQLY